MYHPSWGRELGGIRRRVDVSRATRREKINVTDPLNFECCCCCVVVYVEFCYNLVWYINRANILLRIGW